MSVYTLKRGDYGFPIRATLKDESGLVSLLGAEVRFKMAPAPESDSPALPIDAPAIVTDYEKGQVEYVWQAGDTAVAGVYRAEWQVTFANGAIETFPSEDYNTVLIRVDLG